jgi:hypothetical protein
MGLKTCQVCDGTGVTDHGTDKEQQCLYCGGKGFVPDDDENNNDKNNDDILNTIEVLR